MSECLYSCFRLKWSPVLQAVVGGRDVEVDDAPGTLLPPALVLPVWPPYPLGMTVAGTLLPSVFPPPPPLPLLDADPPPPALVLPVTVKVDEDVVITVVDEIEGVPGALLLGPVGETGTDTTELPVLTGVPTVPGTPVLFVQGIVLGVESDGTGAAGGEGEAPAPELVACEEGGPTPTFVDREGGG